MAKAKKNFQVAPHSTQAATGEKLEMAEREVPRTETNGSKSQEEMVREAAYRRWEARGGEHGGHEEDWRNAEEEVRPPERN